MLAKRLTLAHVCIKCIFYHPSAMKFVAMKFVSYCSFVQSFLTHRYSIFSLVSYSFSSLVDSLASPNISFVQLGDQKHIYHVVVQYHMDQKYEQLVGHKGQH